MASAALPARRPDRALRAFVRNPLALVGAAFILLFVVAALAAPWVAPYDPLEMDLLVPFAPPSPAHPLGTDNFGRDTLSRLLYGSRVSLLVGVVVVGIASALGTLLGLLAGYYGGLLEGLIMRTVDVFYAFPFLVLVIAVIAVFGPNVVNVMWTLGLVSWPVYARLVRAQVLVLRDTEYVEAARAAGALPGRVMLRHILPNALTPVVVTATFGVPEAILASAALGFLGLGVQPPTPEWGAMVSEAVTFIRLEPALIVWPGVAIMLLVMSFNFVGDGLRDALDPRETGR